VSARDPGLLADPGRVETRFTVISVDDHVIEPPNVWQDRLPEKFKAIGPRIERRKVKNMKFVGGVFS